MITKVEAKLRVRTRIKARLKVKTQKQDWKIRTKGLLLLVRTIKKLVASLLSIGLIERFW